MPCRDSTKKGYPLKIEAKDVVVEESPFDKTLIIKMLPRLNYEVAIQAGRQLQEAAGEKTELPATLPADYTQNEEFLQALQHVLFDIHLVEGFLICPDSGRRFPVKDSIPNMILHEDEI